MLVLMLPVWNGCSAGKQDALDDLEQFVVELQENGESYTKEDWKKAAERYVLIEEALRVGEYTVEVQVQIVRLKAECVKLLLLYAAGEFKSQMRDMKKQLKGAASEMESFMDELEEVLEE